MVFPSSLSAWQSAAQLAATAYPCPDSVPSPFCFGEFPASGVVGILLRPRVGVVVVECILVWGRELLAEQKGRKAWMLF